MQPLSTIAALGVLVVCLAIISLANAPLDWPAERKNGGHPAVKLGSRPREVGIRAARALQKGARLDLNSATSADLELLPGIGPKLATRIVDYRNQHGPFLDVDGVLNVTGIGSRKLDRIKPLVAAEKSSKRSTSIKTNNNNNLYIENHVTCKDCREVSRLGVEGGNEYKGPNLKTQEELSRQQVVETQHAVKSGVDTERVVSKTNKAVEASAEEGAEFYDIY